MLYDVTETIFIGKDVTQTTEMVLTETNLEHYARTHYGDQEAARLWMQLGQQDSGKIEIQGRKLEASIS